MGTQKNHLNEKKKHVKKDVLENIYYFMLKTFVYLKYPLTKVILKFDQVQFLYPPQTLFVGGILFSRLSVRPSVTLCFLNNSKSHCRIFIKPCKHVHICKTNTLEKKVRARGQFY